MNSVSFRIAEFNTEYDSIKVNVEVFIDGEYEGHFWVEVMDKIKVKCDRQISTSIKRSKQA